MVSPLNISTNQVNSVVGWKHASVFLLALMKLKLAVQNQDLAYQFGIHITSVKGVPPLDRCLVQRHDSSNILAR